MEWGAGKPKNFGHLHASFAPECVHTSVPPETPRGRDLPPRSPRQSIHFNPIRMCLNLLDCSDHSSRLDT
ncbi:hypothetical protein Y1Q_0014195 [Alligator mississippiensis]|uniref:Uncharacterized protein n=1 Tax=Alligator mississippiensis TaxID=8496 RepID=A0A151MU39_ALLMI|nr:hypothetical protein Y1Q_0014195 [Alligator mississippiensis]